MTKLGAAAASSSVVWSAQRARRRLLLGVALFAVALGGPLALLMKHVHDQLRVEAYAQLGADADELAVRIERRAQDLLAAEEARRFEEFTFLNVLGNVSANFLTRSPLSKFPAESRLPGLVGYFQLDPDGHYSTPLLPRDAHAAANVTQWGIDAGEFARRRAREHEILQILNANDIATATGPAAAAVAEEQLAKTQIAATPAAPSALADVATNVSERDAKDGAAEGAGDQMQKTPNFEEGDLYSQATDYRKGAPRAKKEAIERKVYAKRKQEVTVADSIADGLAASASTAKSAISAISGMASASRTKAADAAYEAKEDASPAAAAPKAAAPTAAPAATAVRTFQGELDPFQFGFLTSGHVVLYRKVWREGRRYIQGALMDRDAFLDSLFREPYDESPLSATATLAAYHGADLLATYAPDASGAAARKLLAKHQLAAPFDAVSLFFTVNRVVVGSSVAYVATICALLIIVLAAGMLTIYLAGRRQIALAQQQRDFVSAVSHELKTPLTSIRMYSEMLREGWADEAKKRGYYDFIFAESERLSRLIANVLQLARLSRGQTLTLEKLTAGEAYRRVAAVIATQLNAAGFEASELVPAGDGAPVLVDVDALTQIFVNLVDNAIKFSRPTDRKLVETGFEFSPTGGEVRFFVRDHGPGIPRDQLKRIFQLFYRPENELTRRTKGTGIGLALVSDLARQMRGKVDVESAPGETVFRVAIPTAS